MNRTAPWILACALLTLAAPALRAQPVKTVVTDAKVACAAPFKLQGGACSLTDEEAGKLDANACKGPGLAFVGKPLKCYVIADQVPAPSCGPSASNAMLLATFDKDLKLCVASTPDAARTQAQTVRTVVTDAPLTCPAPFKLKGGACTLTDDEAAALDAATCKGAGLVRVGTPPKCFIVADQVPMPSCGASPSSADLKTAFDKDLKLCVASAAAATPAIQLKPVKTVITDASMSCPAPFKLQGGACALTADDAGKLDADTCKGAGLAFVGSPAKCFVVAGQVPTPKCGTSASNSNLATQFDADLKQCVAVDTTPRSAPGSYKGDCFWLPSPSPIAGLKGQQMYTVTDQSAADSDGDKLLTVKEGKYTLVPTMGCQVTGGEAIQVPASRFVTAGANRYGYAYGMLTMPYKYYLGAKSFTSSVPIGAYLGWRVGQVGSGYTLAVAATTGSVTADTVDPTQKDSSGNAKVTGTAQVAALSYAMGVIFDVAKDPKNKPFKAGLFIGKDFVNNDATISFRYNRKTWIALQLGFDFTDN